MSLKPVVSRLGVGPAYPFQFTSSGQVKVLSEEQEVENCLVRLLSTNVGEEPWLYRNGVPFGVNTSKALFTDPDTAKNILTFEINLAVETWESERVKVLRLDFAQEKMLNGQLKYVVLLTYLILNTNKVKTLSLNY